MGHTTPALPPSSPSKRPGSLTCFQLGQQPGERVKRKKNKQEAYQHKLFFHLTASEILPKTGPAAALPRGSALSSCFQSRAQLGSPRWQNSFIIMGFFPFFPFFF